MSKSKIENDVLSDAKDRKSEIIILPDRSALAREAASRFVLIARRAIAESGRFAVALSGGSTPRDLYLLLATPEFSSQIDWRGTHLFWSDERAVPPDHPHSNFRMATEALISQVPIPQENVRRIRAELEPFVAAKDYAQTLKEFFLSNAPSPFQRGTVGRKASRTPSMPSGQLLESRDGFREGDQHILPRFDLLLLGLGEDAHTASLFPHTAALNESARWVVANYVEKLKTWRITLTPPVLNSVANILFLVAGAEKAKAVRNVLRGEQRPNEFPAQLVQPTDGSVLWLLDQQAGAKL